MGSPDSERGRGTDEGPDHAVTVQQAFELGKYEVTQAQWEAVMGTAPTSCGSSDYGTGGTYPAYCVSWNDVAGPGGFIEKVNQHLGTNKYRLPSEAEWEYAARAGTTGPFSFAAPSDWNTRCESWLEARNHMWWCGNAGGTTHPVGGKEANGWGLHDMHGNVDEWVQDFYHSSYEGAPTDGSAWESASGTARIFRGGYFATFAHYCRSAERGYKAPYDRSHGIGFRLAASVQENPLTGTVGIRDSRKLWRLDGPGIQAITVTVTPVGGGTPLSATMAGAVYTINAIPPGEYDLECTVTYEEEVRVDNTSTTRQGGCTGGTLTKSVVTRVRGVTAPGTVDIELPRPVVMIHGYRSCYQKWFDPSSSTDSWDNHVRLVGTWDGDDDRGFISLTPNYDFTASGWDTILEQALGNIDSDLFGLSSQINDQEYPQWDIIAHSMGGVVSRLIANGAERYRPLSRALRYVFMMGTPNSGVGAPGFIHLSESAMQKDFNHVYPDLAGKYAAAWAGTDGWAFSTASDSLLFVDSVQHIYQLDYIEYSGGSGWLKTAAYSFREGQNFTTRFFDHFQLGSPDSLTILVNEILPELRGGVRASGATASAVESGPEDTPLVAVAAGSLRLDAGQTTSLPFPCEPTDLLVGLVAAGCSDLTYLLLDPAAATVSGGATPAGTVEHGMGPAGEEWYAVTNPETGTWELRLTAGASACDADYTVMVRSPLELQVSVADPVVAQGGVAELLANWKEALPPGTTVTISADLVDAGGATVETVTLHDDGGHDDGQAGDGLYAGASQALGTAGRYDVRFDATGQLGGSAPFARTKGALLDAIVAGQIFTGVFSDSAVDSDNDGTPDSVASSIGVDIPEAGAYVVTGRLVDGDGYPLDRGVGHLEATATGAQSITLQLSLAAAGCGQFAGGFSLTDLELRDGATLAVLDQWTEAVPTAVYDGATFGCQATTPAPRIVAVNPPSGFPGETEALLISGEGFQSGAQVAFGTGVSVQQAQVLTDDTAVVTVAIDAGAAVGPRDVTVTNPDLSQGTLAGGFSVAADQAPSVSISHPANQQSVSGLVTFSASASDDRGIAAVEFRVDGDLVGSDGSFPYQTQWHSGSAAAGSHVLVVTARDTIGQTSAAQVGFEVVSTTRPPRRRIHSGGPAPCTYSLSPASRSHGAGAETGTIDVSTADGCPWTATPGDGWIHVDSGASGSGSGTVSYSVDANAATTARVGSIAVASESFAISQAGSVALEEVTISLPGDVPIVLVRIPAGTFLMGSPTSERNRGGSERQHQVTLTQDYYIGKSEVTQEQWEAVTGSTPAALYGVGDDFPVYNVSWEDVAGSTGFIALLNQHLTATGQPAAGKLRLPTEAEWEYAARAGTTGPFSFGDDTSCGLTDCSPCALFDQYMWWCGNRPKDNGSTVLTSQPVGQKQANPWGLFDMHGNVMEWVADWSGSYPSDPVVDPTGPATGSYRLWRGGSWGHSGSACRSAYRDSWWPDVPDYAAGFRLAYSP